MYKLLTMCVITSILSLRLDTTEFFGKPSSSWPTYLSYFMICETIWSMSSCWSLLWGGKIYSQNQNMLLSSIPDTQQMHLTFLHPLSEESQSWTDSQSSCLSLSSAFNSSRMPNVVTSNFSHQKVIRILFTSLFQGATWNVWPQFM